MDQAINPIQVLIDIMISLLTKCYVFLRHIVNQSFIAFVNEVDSYCVENLTGIVTRKIEDYLKDMMMEDEDEDSIDDEEEIIEEDDDIDRKSVV